MLKARCKLNKWVLQKHCKTLFSEQLHKLHWVLRTLWHAESEAVKFLRNAFINNIHRLPSILLVLDNPAAADDDLMMMKMRFLCRMLVFRIQRWTDVQRS